MEKEIKHHPNCIGHDENRFGCKVPDLEEVDADTSHPPEDWKAKRTNLLSLLAWKPHLAADALDAAYLAGMEDSESLATERAIAVAEELGHQQDNDEIWLNMDNFIARLRS